ncbi:MAG: hypothetical protein IKW68_01910, partial [Clostridia bacterium]|nr:hypothetical protein [Clostridia bacterium]
FPNDKKRGISLKWLKGAKGLPVVLKTSAFDVHAIPRARIGFEKLTAEITSLQDKINSLTQEMSDILSRAAEAELKALELEAELLDADNLIGELRDEIEEAKEASSSKIRSRVSPAKVEAKEKDRYSFLSYVKRLFV